MTTKVQGENRFKSDAGKYAAYLDTPEGRLRTDLTFANLQDFLPVAPESLGALDLGCGTGTTAVRLARLGIHVTLVDSSPAMLDLAQRAAAEAGVSDKITLQQGDAAQLADMFSKESFDIILCHNLLEFVEDSRALLSRARKLLRDSSSILSLLVRNQAGEVLKAALLRGDLAAAEQSLTADWGQESLYGGKIRLFKKETLEEMLKEASLTLAVRRVVRVLADYLPPQISRSAEYERIFALERKLGIREEFFPIARYLHCLARSAPSSPKGDE